MNNESQSMSYAALCEAVATPERLRTDTAAIWVPADVARDVQPSEKTKKPQGMRAEELAAFRKTRHKLLERKLAAR